MSARHGRGMGALSCSLEEGGRALPERLRAQIDKAVSEFLELREEVVLGQERPVIREARGPWEITETVRISGGSETTRRYAFVNGRPRGVYSGDIESSYFYLIASCSFRVLYFEESVGGKENRTEAKFRPDGSLEEMLVYRNGRIDNSLSIIADGKLARPEDADEQRLQHDFTRDKESFLEFSRMFFAQADDLRRVLPPLSDGDVQEIAEGLARPVGLFVEGGDRRSLERILSCRERILGPLSELTGDLRSVHYRAMPSVAKLLSYGKGVQFLEMSKSLYSEDPLPTKLMGAVGLAGRNEFSDQDSIRVLFTEVLALENGRGGLDGVELDLCRELAIIGLGQGRIREGERILTARLKQQGGWRMHAREMCRALGLIGGRSAESTLHSLLEDKEFEQPAGALDGLVLLGAHERMRTAIDRLSLPFARDAEAVVYVLAMEDWARVELGFDVAKWRQWWEEKGEAWKKSREAARRNGADDAAATDGE